MEQINEKLKKYLNGLAKVKNNARISTGFLDIDTAIKGLDESKLIIVASRPSMGKTNLLLNLGTNVAVDEKIPVAIFSLEMSKEQCIERMIALRSEVAKNKISNNDLNDEEITKVKETIKELGNTNIFIDDFPAISINELKAKCKKLKNEKDIGLIIIDYLQLIDEPTIKNKDIRTAEINYKLKMLSDELNIPIIVSSQLSNKLEKRKDKRPKLTDFSGQGVEYNDADVIIFLYSDDYYNTDSKNKDIAELIIARNRLGDTGTVKLLLKKDCMKFKNLEDNIEG